MSAVAFPDSLQRFAQSAPTRVAALIGSQRLTYWELQARAAVTACVLRDAVDAAGNVADVDGGKTIPAPVVVALPNSLEFVVTFAAALRLPNPLAVLSPALAPAERERALALLGPAVVVDTPLVVDASLAGSVPPVAAVAGGLIGFTSGSGGAPKAYLRTRASWARSVTRSAPLLGAQPGTITLAPGPLTGGITLYALVETLHSGGTFVSLPRFEPGAIAALIDELWVDRFVGVPTMLSLLLDDPVARGALRAVRTFVLAGAKRSAELGLALAQASPGAELIEYYGASELSFVSLRRVRLDGRGEAAGPATLDRSSVGVPFPGVTVQIRDHAGAAVADGHVGTIGVFSDLVAERYLGEPTSQPDFRAADGWCSVGDRGWLQDGELQIAGREDELVVIAGNNVHPSEVEQALSSYRTGLDAQVIAIADRDRGQRLIAAVLSSALQAIDLDDLHAHLLTRIARYKLPAAFLPLTGWPQTPAGKVDRPRLAELASEPARLVSWPVREH